jgi:hypothetical protein
MGIRVFDVLPFFTLLTVLAMLSSSTTLVVAEFGFPDLYQPFSFGSVSAQNMPRSSITTIQNNLMPFDDLSVQSGLDVPLAGVSPFRSPVTMHRVVKQTMMTPEGQKTRLLDSTYDGSTGQRATTILGI